VDGNEKLGGNCLAGDGIGRVAGLIRPKHGIIREI
jgi:hypothetical protein